MIGTGNPKGNLLHANNCHWETHREIYSTPMIGTRKAKGKFTPSQWLALEKPKGNLLPPTIGTGKPSGNLLHANDWHWETQWEIYSPPMIGTAETHKEIYSTPIISTGKLKGKFTPCQLFALGNPKGNLLFFCVMVMFLWRIPIKKSLLVIHTSYTALSSYDEKQYEIDPLFK